ncbi:MAG: echA14 [Frankiales bacterium]|nr:echA14 [Frankiales bacterium]
MTDLLHDRVRLVLDGPLARVTLARPGAGNGLDLAMAHGVREAVTRACAAVDAGTARVVVLAAEGPMFCVGGDLVEIDGVPDRSSHLAEIAAGLHDGIRMLAACPAPVVSVIGGTAAGGGLGLALSGDVVLAAETAVLTMAYTAAGLSPDCGTSWYLARRLGSARALDMALTNRRVTGAEAAEWGLVSRAVPREELDEAATTLALSLARGPRASLAETKRVVRAAELAALEAHLDDEAAGISRLVGEPDGIEGVTAFLAKRKPVFG